MKRKILSLFCLFFLTLPLHSAAPSLDQQQITQLLSGNTFTGKFSDSNREFAVYFAPSGMVYLQKEGDTSFVYYGKWIVQNHLLVTPWPYLDLEVQQSHKMNFYKPRDLVIYKLQIYPLSDNQYEPYKPRLCGCDPSPPKSFPTCTWHEGRYLIQN